MRSACDAKNLRHHLQIGCHHPCLSSTASLRGLLSLKTGPVPEQLLSRNKRIPHFLSELYRGRRDSRRLPKVTYGCWAIGRVTQWRAWHATAMGHGHDGGLGITDCIRQANTPGPENFPIWPSALQRWPSFSLRQPSAVDPGDC